MTSGWANHIEPTRGTRRGTMWSDETAKSRKFCEMAMARIKEFTGNRPVLGVIVACAAACRGQAA